MKTLAHRLSFLRSISIADVLSLVAWAFVLTIVEGMGRVTDSDLSDGILLLVLAVFAGLTAACHQVRALGWLRPLAWLLRKLSFQRRWLDLDLGIDLRGTPEVERGMPGLFWKPAAALLGINLVAMNLAPWLPSGLRMHLVPISYCLYLAVLTALWFVLLGSTLLFLSLTFCFIHDEAVRRHVRPERRRLGVEFTAMGLLAAGMLAGVLFLPDEIPLAISAVGLGLPALGYLLITSNSVDLLWRRPRHGDGVRSLRWQSSIALELGTAFLLIVALIMLTRGEFLFRGEGPRLSRQLPITTFLGLVSAWSAAGASLVIGRIVYRSLAIERAFRRARTRPFVVEMRGVHGSSRRRLRARLARHGLWIPPRLPLQRRRQPEVRIDVVEGLDPDPLRGLDRHAPVEIALEDLEEEATAARVLAAARRRIRLRLLRGLKIAMRLASAREYSRGTGWWIGVQHWFISGLTRDESEPRDLRRDALVDDALGPRYWRLLPARARAHFLEVTRALDVGLIFCEDSVQFRDLRRVIETLFEVHDIHDGAHRIEERHFVGHPGVRVVLHEFDFDHPFRSELYPEPGYEDIGRGRILHVFRDRSDELEFLELPTDIDSVKPSAGY